MEPRCLNLFLVFAIWGDFVCEWVYKTRPAIAVSSSLGKRELEETDPGPLTRYMEPRCLNLFLVFAIRGDFACEWVYKTKKYDNSDDVPYWKQLLLIVHVSKRLVSVMGIGDASTK